ncbi:unnamed protein product [Bursaphelenchus okinawaensis]|uniref:Uncharacterized protein n=1 Tax=Bursaphelenchus okinawaensis TaxID=465554 RepID=A0A811JSC3_9BILA|nr:unnamed protein product [Bursaphelenchus okinawaensis]CAG9080803.1 unnamed protein product [Bursaphelenchus okinawaensis]
MIQSPKSTPHVVHVNTSCCDGNGEGRELESLTLESDRLCLFLCSSSAEAVLASARLPPAASFVVLMAKQGQGVTRPFHSVRS